MNEEHKLRIRSNFQTLVEKCTVGPLLDELCKRRVFSEGILETFTRNSDGARQLFMQVQTRGPKAFENLVMGLIESNQIELAKLLDPNNRCISERGPGGAQAFILPPDEMDEIYDINKSQDPVVINVTHSTNFEHDEPRENKAPVYFTRSKSRGMVKIINVYNVRDHNPRRGSRNDVSSLQELFMQIGMDVDVTMQDLTAQEIKDDLRQFVNNPKLKNADVAILVIMSHGSINDSDEFFYGCDMLEVSTRFVEDLFSNAKCKYMQGKPKIIIYQVCRGRRKDYGVNRHPIETDGAPQTKLPQFSDLLIINSTLREHVTHRDIYMGAWYIQMLCYVFMKHCHNTDVESMLKMIQVNIQRWRTSEHTMQTSEYVNRAFQLCYLNPGIYMDNGLMKKL